VPPPRELVGLFYRVRGMARVRVGGPMVHVVAFGQRGEVAGQAPDRSDNATPYTSPVKARRIARLLRRDGVESVRICRVRVWRRRA
jgi:hypothetical protein